jgi:hypothetical protein
MADDGAAKKRKIKEDHAAKTKRQVMTRMMDKVSDDFVNNFADTRVDEGPEAAARNAQLQAFAQETEAARQAAEALAAREEREAREKAEGEAQQTFKGFAALMGRKNTAEVKVGGMFARLLGEDADSQADLGAIAGAQSAASGFADSGEAPDLSAQPADGVIKTRAGGKKRGLYTSCMNKPVLGGEPHRPLSMSQDPSISSNQNPAQDIAARVSASRQANAMPKPVAPAAPANNQAGWKKIDAEPLSKLAEAARSANNLPPAVPQTQAPASAGSQPGANSQPGASAQTAKAAGGQSPGQAGKANVNQGDHIPATTAKSIKDRSEAMAKMLPSGAREFTLPPMPSAAELSTLRRLANDGKGTKAIPASAFEQSRSPAQPEPVVSASEAPQAYPVAAPSGPMQSIFGKVCAGLSRLFGRGK